MCLIIYNRGNDAKVPEKYLDAAYENNPHGFGMMWADSGKVQIVRGLFDLQDIKSMLKSMDGYPHVVHFRYRTRGPIDDRNCHPHRVLSRKIDGEDLWMMHNGTFFHLKSDEEESDTVKFAKHLQSALRVYGPDSLFDKQQLHRMASRVGAINKLVFLRGDGKIALVNKSEGFEEDGCWYSNTYSLKPGYRDKQAMDLRFSKLNTVISKGSKSTATGVSKIVVKADTEKRFTIGSPDAWSQLDLSSKNLLTPKNQKKGKKKKLSSSDTGFKSLKKHVAGKRSIITVVKEEEKVATAEEDFCFDSPGDSSLH